MKVMKIQALKNGTAIDHLPPGTALEVIKMLGIQGENTVAIGMNLESKKMGSKDLVKIENKALTQHEIDKIALVAPHASINIIKDYEVVKKMKVKIPDSITGVKCFNPNCITNQDRVVAKFLVVRKEPLKIRYHYCERYMEKADIKLV